MATKQHRATPLIDLADMLALVNDYGLGTPEAYLEFRPRTSNAKSAWQAADEDHLINAEKNNYRLGIAPPIGVSDNYVHDYENGEKVAIKDVKHIIDLVSKAKKTGLDVKGKAGEFAVTAWASGDVSIGCQTYDEEQVEEIANQLAKYK